MLDADQIVTFLLAKKWLALAVFFLMYFGRLLKSDSAFPLSFDRFRPLAIIVTSQLLFLSLAIQQGTPVKNAAITAAVVAVFAMGLFPVLVKTVLGDREWPAWLKVLAFVFPPGKDDAPRPPKLPTILGVLSLLFLTGCPAFLHTVRTIEQDVGVCLAEHQDLPDEQALLICHVAEAEKLVALELLHKMRSESAKRAHEAAAIAEEAATRRAAKDCAR